MKKGKMILRDLNDLMKKSLFSKITDYKKFPQNFNKNSSGGQIIKPRKVLMKERYKEEAQQNSTTQSRLPAQMFKFEQLNYHVICKQRKKELFIVFFTQYF